MDVSLFFQCSCNFSCNPALTAVLKLPSRSTSLAGLKTSSSARLVPQICNLQKSRCNPSLHFLLNFHRKPARVHPPMLLIIMNPTVQQSNYWLLIEFPCSVTFFVMVFRWFDRNTVIKLTFLQLRLHPFLQLLSQMRKTISVTCGLIVLTLLCLR